MPPFKYDKSQREALKYFQEITGCSEKVAIQLLQGNQWKLDQAMDNFYDSQIDQIFLEYRDPEKPDWILATGMEKFIEALKIDCCCIDALVLAWKFGARTQGEFTRDEFINGMKKVNCETVESLRKKLPQYVTEVVKASNKDSLFRSLYSFTFSFGITNKHENKSLCVDYAVVYWEMLLRGRYQELDLWLKFVQESGREFISRDTWMQLLEFIETDPSKHDFAAAWPTLFDDYVRWKEEEEGEGSGPQPSS